MNKVIWEERKLAIKDLCLWDENARFPDKYFNKSEDELIKYFCEKQGKRDFKIDDLAKDITKDFDLPQLEKFVVYDIDNKKIVLEGNRRLTAYKLLSNPDLAPTSKLKDKFVNLKSKISIDESYKIECLITTSEVEGFRYIERKHLKGNNEISWGEQERTHHNKRRGNATKKEEFKVAIGKIIQGLGIPEEMKEQILGPGYVTNFWRIIDSSPAWREFGFDLKKDGELVVQKNDFEEKLKVIILNILQKKDFSGNIIDSRSLNKNNEKEAYLKSISKSDYKKVDVEIEKNTSVDLFDQKSTNITASEKKVRLNPKSTSRTYLIPKPCRLVITGADKINNIYHELRDDLLLDDSKEAVPNAVGVLFRVFLETSIDHFSDKKNVKLLYPNGNSMKLKDKINAVTFFMESNKIATRKQLKNIRSVATNTGSVLSVENFHRYVHSYTHQPAPNDLKTKWDHLEEFFVILWNSLKPKK